MRWLLDAAYLGAACLTAPYWLWRMWTTGKLRTDWRGRFGFVKLPEPVGPRLMIHAVSVGEINAIRLLVQALRARHPQLEVLVTTTTDTGFARAAELFGSDCLVARYPFDASYSVARFLDVARPDVVALVELEVWPNFTAAAASRDIPVAIINGRLSERSYRRYRLIRWFVQPMFARLEVVSMQTAEYARRIIELGARTDRVSIGGTMKWDTAEIVDHVNGARELAESMGIDPARPLIVAGSTAPGEHELLRDSVPPGAQLLCAPRKPEWFEDAAQVLSGCVRRSRGDRVSHTDRYLLDTIGELREAYAIADVVVVGRTFVNLHGSDMIEPVGLGKPVIVGPDTLNFSDSASALEAAGGLIRSTRDTLASTIRELLEHPDQAQAIAARGRDVIRSNQGATAHKAELLLELLRSRSQA